jgi:hypothetical protein
MTAGARAIAAMAEKSLSRQLEAMNLRPRRGPRCMVYPRLPTLAYPSPHPSQDL